MTNAPTPAGPGSTFLITGASRGIGLEFVKQINARGGKIIAAVRDPAKAERELKAAAPSITLVQLDVSDPGSIESLGERIRGRSVDILINNAGVSSPAKTLDSLTAAEMARVFQINSFAPILVTKACLANLRAGSRKTVVQITSILASIQNNTGGSTYAYRGSKAALNQLNKSLSNELASAGFTCVAIHPGWVKTDMGGPDAHLTPRQSVEAMLKTIEGLSAQDTGRFLNYDGATLPW